MSWETFLYIGSYFEVARWDGVKVLVVHFLGIMLATEYEFIKPIT
jgi:hypothetical protein